MTLEARSGDRVIGALVVGGLVGAVAGGAGTVVILGHFQPLFVILGGLSGLGATGVTILARYDNPPPSMADHWLLSRSTLVDLPALAAIPAMLLAIHYLVPNGGQTLAFDYGQFDPLTMWTSGYVHLDGQHLQSNLAGYWVAILPTWLLYRFWERRREFWLGVAVVVLVTPVLVSLGSFFVYQLGSGTTEPVSRGFSGVIGAVSGLLWASIPIFVYSRYGQQRALEAGPAALLLPMVGLLLSVLSKPSLPVVGLSVVGIGLVLLGVVPRRFWLSSNDLQIEWSTWLILGYCIVTVGYLLTNLFATTTTHNNVRVNIIGHDIALVTGIILVIMGAIFEEVRR